MGSWLVAEGYSYASYGSARQFKNAFRNGSFDLVRIDWQLPDATGLDILIFVREIADGYLPMVFITARDQEQDEVRALNAGADDDVAKPASRRLTLARIRTLFRRAVEDRNVMQVGAYRIDRVRDKITATGRPVSFADKKFQLADLLLSNADQFQTRSSYSKPCGVKESDAGTRSLGTHASRVRQKWSFTQHNKFWLRPVYGHGYRLVRLPANANHPPGRPTPASILQPNGLHCGS